ncbi:hypothetical protein C8J56DRAFT_525288 [Mycena floridula]|nr:hypothetical protein C8J56DRAFT_525288 [Mycena floridula]
MRLLVSLCFLIASSLFALIIHVHGPKSIPNSILDLAAPESFSSITGIVASRLVIATAFGRQFWSSWKYDTDS